MKSFSDTVDDISFACYGKTYNNRPRQKKRKSRWFNDDCKYAKNLFLTSYINLFESTIKNNPLLYVVLA